MYFADCVARKERYRLAKNLPYVTGFLLKQLHDLEVHREMGLTKKCKRRVSVHTVHVLLPKADPSFKKFARKPATKSLGQIPSNKYCFQVAE